MMYNKLNKNIHLSTMCIYIWRYWPQSFISLANSIPTKKIPGVDNFTDEL